MQQIQYLLSLVMQASAITSDAVRYTDNTADRKDLLDVESVLTRLEGRLAHRALSEPPGSAAGRKTTRDPMYDSNAPDGG